MQQIEIKGNDLNSIIQSFRKEHNLKDWELEYEVVSEGSKGLFGLFGKKPATVKFKLLDTEERVKLFLEQLLKRMQISFEKIDIQTEQKTLYVTIKNSSDAGFLIGKNGNMLEHLQYLVNRVFENVKGLDRIYLDTEDYRLRQEQTLLRNYIDQINSVKTTGKSMTLDPMPANERRIIHKFVEGEKDLKTTTIGEGDNKCVVIMPASHKEPETKAKKVELTPQQKAQQSYQRHNNKYPNSHPSKQTRKSDKAKRQS
ncbi:MAG TPA: RNA-binding cell elongation regulator Jag/EloR [Candidatus Cloacimonadota bacterium]|nr:RNA-binding cell elongation regulator Jag/EloR [Candidatus Cloacimonadota bacterium]